MNRRRPPLPDPDNAGAREIAYESSMCGSAGCRSKFDLLGVAASSTCSLGVLLRTQASAGRDTCRTVSWRGWLSGAACR